MIARNDHADEVGSLDRKLIKKLIQHLVHGTGGVLVIENITGHYQCIDLAGQHHIGNFFKNLDLFRLARPARQFMPKMPIGCMQDFYGAASFASHQVAGNTRKF